MKILVPFDDSKDARDALHEACRILTPLDELIVLASVVVPRHLPADASPGELWKQTCRAEVHLASARAIVERITHYGDMLHCVRVQATDRVAAVVAGATFYEADTILLVARATVRGRVAAFFGATAAIVRQASCDVRVLYKVAPHRRQRLNDLRSLIDVSTTSPCVAMPADPADEAIPQGSPSREHEGEGSYAT
ncbi:MAG: universal stress protein [Chloroflexota bacterium]|nr:universal stress protein [Chloroflexota bacterium]